MGIVTKKGDAGKTTLLSGETVSKASARVEAYGTVDELGSLLGLARVSIASMEGEGFSGLAEQIFELQLDLSRFAGELASLDPESCEWVEPTGETYVTRIEDLITTLEAEVSLPKSFVVPGACVASAQMDVARAVSRRLERRLVALYDAGEYKNTYGLHYANRVADYLFMLARAIEKFSGIPFQTKGE